MKFEIPVGAHNILHTLTDAGYELAVASGIFCGVSSLMIGIFVPPPARRRQKSVLPGITLLRLG